MRLAFLCSHPIQYQVPLFRALHNTFGVHVTALFCHDHGVQPSYDNEFGTVFCYDVPLLTGYEHQFLYNASPTPNLTPMGMFNPSIIWIVASGRFDAVVVHGYNSVTSQLGLIAPRLRTRLLLRGESNLLPKRGLPKRIFKRATLRATFCRTDHFLSIGSLNTAYYKHYGVDDERITLAPYSVDNEFFASRSAESRRAREDVRRRLDFPARDVIFLFAAKIVPRKRPLDLLRAFARAKVSHRAGLVYVGSGESSNELAASVREHGLDDSVRLLGFRNQTALPEIYGASDVLVLPSDFEPWGLAVNEAMACGTAAVVSDQVGAGPDLVGDHRCTFRVGDIDALARILRSIVDEPRLLTELKANSASRIGTWGLRETAAGVIRGVEMAIATPRIRGGAGVDEPRVH